MGEYIPDSSHIRHCLLMEYNKKCNASEAHRNICDIYGDVISIRQCQEWFSRFRSGDFSLQDKPKSGRPSALDNNELRALVELNPRQTIEDMAQTFGCSWSTIQEHLLAIGKHYRVGKWVPHKLSEENKQMRISTCQSLLIKHEKEHFLRSLVTGDEKWILFENPACRKQYLSRGQKPLTTARSSLHPKKALLCVWWDQIGIIHFELLKMGQTVTADIYCQQLERLHEALIAKRPAMVNRRRIILQQDNARPHTAKVTQLKIKSFDWDILSHPPYSPDIAPSDYHLFRSLQHFLAGKCFDDIDAVKNALLEYFDSKKPSFYQEGIENLVQRWTDVINNDGDYIDK